MTQDECCARNLDVKWIYTRSQSLDNHTSMHVLGKIIQSYPRTTRQL